MKLIKEITDKDQLLKQWRHEIHRHPELAFKEHKTSQLIADILRQIGVDEVHEGIGKTGVVGIIRNGEGPRIGLRADMDALPIIEEGNHSYISETPGIMHACGHDGHVTMLLGAALYLNKTRNFSGTVVCIFQPAEEKIAGAPAMIKDGLLEKFPLDCIYTLHSWPGASTNNLFVNHGTVMASVNDFELTVHGTGGHAAMPHLTTDPIVAGAEMVLALQTLVSRRSDPQDPLVLSVTVFQAGYAMNIIPNEVIIKGTVRYANPELGHWLPKKMRDVLEGLARVHDVSIDLDYRQRCPTTYNSDKETSIAQQVIREMECFAPKGKEKKLSMGSDDFCFYLEEVPGAYVYIGNGEDSMSLHHSEYDFNDNALSVGASFYANLVETIAPI